ncbi:acetoacetate--CoA ligase [Aeromicrobium sp. CTD01-1L150]|uniref:acetoacetate--CoA ligase n=1 Tax=Aeromicrobium sp. CTD01-1L150 TaxID=3341830 RepID=UPI0035C073E5
MTARDVGGADVTAPVEVGTVTWQPAHDWRSTTRIGAFVQWLERERGVRVQDWSDLWGWSVEDLGGFWSAVWEFFGVESDTPPGTALAREAMPGAEWFPGASINYARHALTGHDVDPHETAIIGHSQTRQQQELTWAELRDDVARARAGLQRLGVGRGDRVCAYLPNIPETVVAYLATVSLGAVWASCAPELGPRSVVDRLGQIDPTVLLVVDGYTYGDRRVDRTAEVEGVRQALPGLRHVVHVPYGGADLDGVVTWHELLAEPAEPGFEPVPFDHPMCVLFSSGTTGKPKAIVHCHGGLVLEHLKNHALSWDLGPGDRLMWFSTTTWMVWNSLVSGLLVGSSIVLVDGNPAHPDLDLQWRLAASTRSTMVGLSPAFIMASRRHGARPAEDHELSALRQVGAAGSPLPVEGYAWIREQLGPRVLLNVGSGGTDVCGGIVQGSPMQPVVAGEISGACLGVAASAFDEAGNPVVGELGELVITRPMPSMPVGFWGDDGSRYRETYFETYPGIWRHGDWVRFSPSGSCVVAGRSDATLNRGGVRLGTAEFYDVLAATQGVDDALVVHLEDPDGGNGELILFVVPAEEPFDALPEQLVVDIRRDLRTALSPRHVPDRIVAVPAVPVNRTGKKLEVPVKRLLLGAELQDVVATDTVADPAVWEPFVALAQEVR